MSRQLIKRLKTGDQKAFKEVYLLYYDKLIHLGKSFEHGFLSPDDFVQETFLKIYHNREQLKVDAPLDKQLYVICRNLILNNLKRDKKVISIHGNLVDPFFEGLTYSEDDLQIKQKLFYKWVAELPDQQQKVYTLHKIERYSYTEIAQLTNLSKKTIANHIYLATKFIQKKVAEH